MNHEPTESLARELHGPILVLGASGFIGANLLRTLRGVRTDVVGTASREPAWRLAAVRGGCVSSRSISWRAAISRHCLDRVQPATVFDCVAYGAYSFEQDVERMYQTNVVFKQELIEQLLARGTHCYIHAGSSSEYGARAAGPDEASPAAPNSHYAVTKSAAAGLVYFCGHHRGLRCANLRLYSVYGPLEDRSRLMPTLVAHAAERRLPPFVEPETSRDFMYIDDVVRAFLCAAVMLRPEHYGDSFNIGSGRKTTIRELAHLAKQEFAIEGEPEFSTMPARSWDLPDWYANPARAREVLGLAGRGRAR